MAVTEVGTATTDWQEGTGSLSISRTVTAGSKGLTVQLSYYNGSGAVSAPTLSWNTSEAMTLVAAGINGNPPTTGGDYRAAVYFLANPTSGTHSVTATFTNTVYWRAAVREWSNSSSTHGGANAHGSDASPTVDVTAVVAGEVIIDAVAGGDTLTAGSGQSTTGLYNDVLITASSPKGAASTDTTSTTTVAMNWTLGASNEWAIAAMALVEDGGGVSASRPMFRGH